METNPYASLGYPKNMKKRNIYGYGYAKISIFPTVPLSNERCLTGLRDLRTGYTSKALKGVSVQTDRGTAQRWRAVE